MTSILPISPTSNMYPYPSNSKDMVTIKVASDKFVSRSEWIDEIVAWCKDHNITAQCHGSSWRLNGENVWYIAEFTIPNPNERTLFMLRWA
jgi:hypothetical protein